MIVTIDGPAGAGKSTVSRRLAEALTQRTSTEFEYLDTGSMYRAVALLGIRNGVDWNDSRQLETLVAETTFDIDAGRTYLGGEDVTDAVRSPEITSKTRFAANNPAIRNFMVSLQRRIAERFLQNGKGLVTEGRDQGTIVFPDARFKFFLTATPEERARRRYGELIQRGEQGDFNEILQNIVKRDQQDSERPVGPLKMPEDAVEIISDDMNIAQVVDHLVDIVCGKLEKNTE